MEQEIHFRVDASLYNETVRDAYWFEDRKKWALDVLRCLEGITFKQEHDFLTGNAIFENSEDGTIELIYAEDKKFKEKLQSFFFRDGKMKVPEDSFDRHNFSGWLTREGFFIRCRGGDHLALSEMICDKIKLLKDNHCRNYERMLELSGAIKISSGTVLFEGSPSGKQVEILTKFIEDGGHLNSGGCGGALDKDRLLDWLDIKFVNGKDGEE